MEGKIESVMSFLVNERGFEASHVARCPVVLSLSFGKWIVLVLKSKGMVKKYKRNVSSTLTIARGKCCNCAFIPIFDIVGELACLDTHLKDRNHKNRINSA
ncbi:hypothetical protein JHK85_043086 [Glycine max]|nr:hypothetical protein JHK85_043086 [Glycine max]